MNAVGSKCFLCLLQIWRDEDCASPVEGAILACAMATVSILAAVGLKSELRRIFDLFSDFVGSFPF